MNQEIINKTIALSGIHQALINVQNIAWHGLHQHEDIDVCLYSLFQTDPESFAEVYGGIAHLRSGLQALRSSFTNKRDKLALERAKYMVSLMLLSKNLQKNKGLSDQVKTTLSLLEEASTQLDTQRDYIIERLAQLYQNAISPLTPRVIIYGEPQHLNIEKNAATIRALLLAGLRSCLLWYQAGGSQLNLLLGKNNTLKAIDQLLVA